ncbi:MAG: hypothetical protein B7Z37_25030 [Verrucomicrobia bacterium 12-59-8]|nr:MAG: hypothetical protein B7Z37_25030 [Verrucomicrobia bacterium 12-59-8]
MPLVGFSSEGHPQQSGKKEFNPAIDDRALPQPIFDKWHARFNFTVDAAASTANRKLSHYWTERDNGLDQSWAGHRVYCNPPFSDIAPWVRKAWAERMAQMVVLLLPANRTEQGWWQDMIEPFRDRTGSVLRIEFLKGRLRFLKPGERVIKGDSRPPFGCLLAIWDWAGGLQPDPRPALFE